MTAPAVVPELAAHLTALAAVWVLTVAAGGGLGWAFRVRTGWPDRVLLGLVYWAGALYALPFRGGLDAATAVAVVGGIAAILFRPRSRLPRRWSPVAAAVLVLGCGVYATSVLWNHAPPGVDATMVGVSARTVALHRGLPADYAPLFPGLFFPSVNLTLPAVGGAAVRLGASPASVPLAVAHLAYSAWVLAVYSLVRRWTPAWLAAVLAVAQAWGSRWAQNTVGWGGFPTVGGLAVGVYAAHLMLALARAPSARRGGLLGLTAAAVPLAHGVSAAVWLYAVAPVVAVAGVVTTRNRRGYLLALGLAVAVGAVVLAEYAAVGRFRLSEAEIEWSKGHVREDAPAAAPFPNWVGVTAVYLWKYAGDPVAILGCGGWVALLLARRWTAAAATAAVAAVLLVVLANGRWWLLPASPLLYPNRVVYWAGPLAAATAALGVRAWRQFAPRFTRYALPPLAVGLLGYAGLIHVVNYQHIVARPRLDDDRWQALLWCRDNLSADAFVAGADTGTAAYLPLIAEVPSTACQVHHCAMDEKRELFAARRVTHRLYDAAHDPPPPDGAGVLFRNPAVVIVALPREK